MSITRRRFVQLAAAATAAAPLVRHAEAGPTNPADPRQPLRPFDYSQVQLSAGPFADPFAAQYSAIHQHYLSLSNDRLLKVYRQRAGLPAPGEDMGGWYDLNGFVPGHSLGQYISGLARIGASTNDQTCHDKVHALVEGFGATLGPKNESILRPDTNLWVCYTLDKHFAGLIDAATLSNTPGAKDLINRVMQGALTQNLLPAKGRDRIGKKDPPYDETFVMPENLFTAGDLTNNPAFPDYAQRYLLDREFFDPLARKEDPLPGQHAYSHAIALSSGAAAYLRGGDIKYKAALEQAFTLLTTEQQYASGGWGPNETFIKPHRGELCTALSTTVDHFETPCGSYAATRLARYLTQMNAPTTRYGDNLERVLYNTILAAKFPDSDGDYPYYSTYSAQATKVYYPKKWPCCSGTLVQTVADYPRNIYFQSNDGLFVSQYISSHLRFTHRGTPVTLTQQSSLPLADATTLTIMPAAPVAFTLRLRIPAWANGASVTVNSRPVQGVIAGAVLTIDRLWRPKDRVHITLPQQFRIEPLDDFNPEIVALLRGPVQYVALEGPTQDAHKARGPGEKLPLPASLNQTGPQRFVESYDGRDITFVPLYTVRDETYTAYFTKA